MNIILIGYRGSGKTTVGRLLAEQLKMPLVDTDELIVTRAGQDIAEIFRQMGEQGFRDLETEALNEALRGEGRILSLGGGAVLRENNRSAIKAAGRNHVFYLHCQSTELHRRISGDTKTQAHRPALTHLGGTREEIDQLLNSRLPLYRQIMTKEIDVEGKTPDQVAKEILIALAECDKSL